MDGLGCGKDGEWKGEGKELGQEGDAAREAGGCVPCRQARLVTAHVPTTDLAGVTYEFHLGYQVTQSHCVFPCALILRQALARRGGGGDLG